MRSIDSATEVARIKADLAARDGGWETAIKARLRRGQAVTRELADAAGIRTKREFMLFRGCLRKCSGIEQAGSALGRTGHLNTLWKLTT
jgi:hypothetical protein